MNTIINLIIIVLIILLCFWIHKKLRKKLSFIPSAVIAILCTFVLPIVLFIWIGSMFGLDDQKDNNKQNAPQIVQTTVVASEPIAIIEPIPEEVLAQKDLGIKPEAFRKNYNAVMAEMKVPDRMPKLDIKKGEVNDVFTVMLSDINGIIGGVDKETGNLKEVTLIFKSDNKNSDEFVVTAIIAASIDKAIVGKKERSFIVDMMTETLKQYKETNEHVEVKKVVGDIEYVSLFNKTTGLWFVIRPKP